jgi:hypothetical protein
MLHRIGVPLHITQSGREFSEDEMASSATVVTVVSSVPFSFMVDATD